MVLPANWSRCRVVGYLTDDDNDPLPVGYKLRFISTSSRLQDSVSHRLVLPEVDEVIPNVTDGYFYVDRLSDTDTDFTSGGTQRQTKVTLLNGATEIQSWWVTVDHTTAASMNFNVDGTIASSGGSAMPALWLTQLEDFSAAPVQGSPTIAAHVAQPDPHPQYVLTDELAKYAAREPLRMATGSITRNGAGAATTAPVVWPDGTAGVYTLVAADTTTPSAENAWTVTYAASSGTKTYTQPAMTRDSSGRITARPAIGVS
ncbi:hypothetical protein EV383_4353 [Pseudonocardia sediminis]|uniref:Uncharacterized protein n=1 Tax=Pseudonocardia sediminis TaxID=1397368 RepID=A0A4Q7V4A1_PSEST|nr:hypothetical protein [Pseudonocardia sediminis]RZT87429.1 hypothetical protein EV383_4353 [Pseudonocardia sediminis]